MAHPDYPKTIQEHRFEALEAVRRFTRDTRRTPGSRPCLGGGFAQLVEDAAAGHDLAGHAWNSAAAPETASMNVRPTPDDAVTPSAVRGGGTAILARRRLADADSVRPSGTDLPPDEVRRILAIAPDDYDRTDVDGSETPVTLRPLRRWTRHPAFRGGRPTGTVVRAWEAFADDGEALGLVLCTGEEFIAVDMSGGCTQEGALAGAAWQISANR